MQVSFAGRGVYSLSHAYSLLLEIQENLFDYINYIKYVLEIFRKGPCMATLSIFEIWYNFC